MDEKLALLQKLDSGSVQTVL